MTSKRTPPSRRGRWRAAVAARAAAQRGDTMIEVLVAALLVALIAAAVLTGYVGVAHLSADQRKHSQADTLAQQDEQRMRSLTITQLAGTQGNETRTTTINGTVYTIVSTAQYVSGTGATSCSAGSASTSADEVATTSTVSWSPMNGRPPVEIHGLVTPGVGGSLIVSATMPNPSGSSPAYVGLQGVTVSISGPSTVPSLVTDANGCAIFGGLAGGSYTVSFTPPTGYVDVNGNTTVANQTVTVTPTQTASASVGPLGQAATVNATFSTSFNGQTNVASTSDQMTLVQTQMTPPNEVFGTDSTATNNTYVSSMTTGASMFPFGTAYTAFAGGCDNPPPTGSPGLVSVQTTAGGTANVTLPEPAMIILPYVGTATNVDDPALSYTGSWTHQTSVSGDYQSTESDATYSASSNPTATYTFNGSSISIIATKGPSLGKMNVTLDGTSQGTVNLYNTTTARQQTVWSSGTLSAGSHTLVISPNTGSIGIDELTYTAVSLMTTKPNIIVTDTDAVCANNKDYPPEQVPTATGGALVSPGLPYGTYTVCVDNGSNHDTITGVANTNYTTGTTVNAYIYSGAPGYGTGVCT